MASFEWPPNGGGSAVPTYTTIGAFPSAVTSGNGALAIALDTNILYESNGTVWQQIAGPGAMLSIGTIDTGTPSANGAQDVNNQLILQSASATVPGLVNDTTQTFAGDKTFTGNVNGSQFRVGTYPFVGGTPGAVFANGSYPGILMYDGGPSQYFFGPNNAGTGLRIQNSGNGNELFLFTGTGFTAADESTGIPYLTVTETTVVSTGSLAGTNLTAGGHASLDLALAGGTMSGVINMGSNKIQAVTDPTLAQDAATKNYVDTVASALNPIQAVSYASASTNYPGVMVANVLTITATGAISVDGSTPSANQRILLKDQSTQSQNGVYVVTTVGSLGVSPVLTRAADYNTAAEVNAGDLVPVLLGTVNATTSWIQTATVVTLNTDPLVFAQWTANPANYLLKANNLSDVSTKATAFNNISPITTTGDMVYSSSGTTNARLPIGSTGNYLAVASGIPTWTAPTSTPTASTLSEWDANKNLSANNFLAGYQTTATAAGTTVLTVSSAYEQIFTGSTTQTVTLPVVSGLANGTDYIITNLSSGVVTVQTSGANTVQAMASNTILNISVSNNSNGTGLTSWTWSYLPANTGLPLTNPMNTGGDIIYGGASGVPTRLVNGSAGQALTSAGSTSAPTWSNVTPTYTLASSDPAPSTGNKVYALSNGPYTVTLPSAAAAVGPLTFLHASTFPTAFTITPSSGQTINEQAANATFKIFVPGESVTLTPDGGANWYVTSRYATSVETNSGALYTSSTSAYTFTISSATVVAGDTYTNNTQTFMVSSSGTVTSMPASGTGAPAASGTLTRATGTGPSTLTFSSVASSVPVKGSSTYETFYWSKSGNQCVFRWDFKFAAGTAGSGDYIVTLPSGLTMNTANMQLQTAVLSGGYPTTGFTIIGTGHGEQTTGGIHNVLQMFPTTATQFKIVVEGAGVVGSSNYPFSDALIVSIRGSFPVLNWQP